MFVNPVNGSKNKDFDSRKFSQATKQESRETRETLRHHSRQPARALDRVISVNQFVSKNRFNDSFTSPHDAEF